jgi:hypothetical protein
MIWGKFLAIRMCLSVRAMLDVVAILTPIIMQVLKRSRYGAMSQSPDNVPYVSHQFRLDVVASDSHGLDDATRTCSLFFSFFDSSSSKRT